MNKYSLKGHLRSELAPFESTFKETSLDDANQQHMCQDETTPDVYDFDRYVRKHFTDPIPASPDAIHIGQKDLYFVEFKNGNVNGAQIRRKFEAGASILKKLLQDFGAKDCQYHFCVVMRDQPRPRWMDFRHVENTKIKFDLQALNQEVGDFYDHIVTESLDFYLKTFRELQCGSAVSSQATA